MPVTRFSAEDANRNLRRNRNSIWPDGRVPTDRLGKLAKLSFTPTFTFSRQDRIMTIGSCFAREIEHRLAGLGFDVPMKQIELPAEERSTKTANDIVSKFTVQSMENELLWSTGAAAPPPPEKLFLQVGEGLWHDPQLVNNVTPASLERLAERRRLVEDAFRQLPSCKVVVITLGLAEAWFDHETGLYLNTAPPGAALKYYPGRFSLDLLSYEDISASLERIYALLKAHGHPDFKVLITVSPVPFKATFSGGDALTANSYSKAVQRAACEAFVRRHDNVDYFPSFEIVTLSDRELVYEKDNVHVGNSTVAYIVDQVLTHYTPDIKFKPAQVGTPKTRREGAEEKPYDLFVLAKHHIQEDEPAKAVEACERYMERFYEQASPQDKATARMTFASALSKAGRFDDAAVQLAAAAELAPQNAENWHNLGRAYVRQGRMKDAEAAFGEAARINPNDPDIHKSLASLKNPLTKGLALGASVLARARAGG